MRALLLAAALIWSSGAAAQTISIRGGEHAEFSRLVLPLPDGASWSFAPAPGGYELRLPPGVRYDLGRAFDRIPRDRIRSLRAGEDGRLGLDVDCDCHAQAYVFGRVGLVIDVIDGAPPPGGLAPGRPGAGRLMSGLLPLLPQGPTGPLLGPLADLPLATPRQAASSPDAAPTGDAAHLEQMRRAILEGFAQAATQNLLDIRPGRQSPAAEEPSSSDHPVQGRDPVPTGASDSGRLEGTPPSLAGAEPRPGVTLRSAVDAPASERPLGATGSPCLDDALLDLASWAGSGLFGAEFAARMAQVSDGRDRLDPIAVEDLARTYLAFGFGREAIRALEMDGTSSRDRDLLHLLARLVDGEPAPADALDDQAGCLGAVAFWRALARDTIRGTDQRERTAMTVALRSLPDELRDHLAPRLSGLFLKAGDALGAEEIAALSEDGTSPATQLARVAILEEIEGAAPALAELERIAATDPRMTPEAMVDLLDLSLDQGRPVPEETLELARALRFEHGGATGRKLLVAEARALSASGRFEQALSLLIAQRMEDPDEDLDLALAEVAAVLTRDLPDAEFLELALGEPLRILPAQAARPVVERLADLGFPDEARRLSSGTSVAREGPVSSARPTTQAADEATEARQESGVAAPDGDATPRQAVSSLSDAVISLRPQVEAPAAEPPGSNLGDAEARLPSARVPADTLEPPVTMPAAERAADPPEVSEQVGEAVQSVMPDALTLAERRALLATAGEVRARARALLEQSPME
ncbi:hypothetical protein [Rubellimicrobium roseum]|uniref:HEAT repeat domain-containing protein n=1 Tax=Rubellimicrobium roseum TaxID=687525 RepID=A0A5C4NBB0_9RHOB|nr:hypothetical protein [Rubellimicrobium roseum]TNC71312.1 hypothetical protein FHG71_12005 [Rubellimicrobium roseum]